MTNYEKTRLHVLLGLVEVHNVDYFGLKKNRRPRPTKKYTDLDI